MKKEKAAIVFIFIVLFIAPVFAFGIGIGMAPADMPIKDVMRGSQYERTVAIFNPDDAAKNFTLRADGEAAGWLGFYEPVNPGVPITGTRVDAKSNHAVLVRINVPGDQPTGTYNATIYAETIASEPSQNSTGVSTALMARTFVTIQVTGEETLDGVVNAITIVEDTEPGYPLRIETMFRNTGNVIAEPDLFLVILKNGSAVASFTQSDIRVRPETAETIVTAWNTTKESVVGDYVASVTVSLSERELSSTSLPFKILPVGTFSRQGNLTNISIEDEPALGAVVKVNAYFRNTGKIGTPAKFNGEVYRDNTRIDTISSDELSVDTGSGASLVSYFKPASAGNYIIRGRVVYSGKETEAKEVSFSVPEDRTAGIGAYAAAAIGVTALGVYAIRRKMNGRAKVNGAATA